MLLLCDHDVGYVPCVYIFVLVNLDIYAAEPWYLVISITSISL